MPILTEDNYQEYSRGVTLTGDDLLVGIADYNQAIKIKSDYANAYNNRGNAKKNLGDKQGAINDYNQAAQLYSQQDNMEWYLKALDLIKNLEK